MGFLANLFRLCIKFFIYMATKLWVGNYIIFNNITGNIITTLNKTAEINEKICKNTTRYAKATSKI